MEVSRRDQNFNITAVSFQLIKQRNGLQFHRALFGDFIVIMIVCEDFRNGYINATKLCQDGGKRLCDWTRLKSAQQLTNIYTEEFGGSRTDPCHSLVDYGGKNKEDRLVSGTYFHPDIVVHIASWVSNIFAFKVSNMLTNFKFQKLTALESKVDQATCAVRKMRSCAAPYTKQSSLRNCFFVIKKNKESAYPYYVIRTQKRNISRALKLAVSRYGNVTVIFKKQEDPNSINLFRLIEQELPIQSRYNHFRTSLSENELILRIQTLYSFLLDM